MSLRPYGGAQAPLQGQALVSSSILPSSANAIVSDPHTPLPTRFPRENPMVIEVPDLPELAIGRGELSHGVSTEEDVRGNGPSHQECRPSEPWLGQSAQRTQSTLGKIVSGIRQNLQEVLSVIKHYPTTEKNHGPNDPSPRSKEQRPTHSFGDTDRWTCKWLGVCGTVNWHTQRPTVSAPEADDEG